MHFLGAALLILIAVWALNNPVAVKSLLASIFSITGVAFLVLAGWLLIFHTPTWLGGVEPRPTAKEKAQDEARFQAECYSNSLQGMQRIASRRFCPHDSAAWAEEELDKCAAATTAQGTIECLQQIPFLQRQK